MAESKAPEVAEKTAAVDEVAPQPRLDTPELSKTSSTANRAQDDALDFLKQHRNDAAVALSKDEAYMARLRRKIDWHVIPFLLLSYTLNFIDKVLLNYAKIMGMEKQLQLTGNNYSNASSSFFIAVLLFSLPNVWLLNRLPIAKCLSVNLVAWGVLCCCHAGLRDYAGLVTVRVLSGAFESGVPPAMVLLAGQYYTASEEALRFQYWYCGMGVGQMLGAITSFGFQHMPPTAALASWRTMFVVLGLITITQGVVVWFLVPDTPLKARFLTNDEKVALVEHTKVSQTGVENNTFIVGQLWEGLFDIGCWGIFLMLLCQSSGSGVITAYSATILTTFGYTPKEAALLNIPSGAINIISTLCMGAFVRFLGKRWVVIAAMGAIATTGAGLLTLPLTEKAGLLAGMYLINVMPGTTGVTFHWLACNTAGHTKRSYIAGGMNAAFAIGNIVGPETFKAVDAPVFRPAKLFLLCMWGLEVGIACLVGLYYAMSNRSRERRQPLAELADPSDEDAFSGMTDKQNPNFRYHL